MVEWKCFACDYTACMYCHPPPFPHDFYTTCNRNEAVQIVNGSAYPTCTLGQCKCSRSDQGIERAYSCSEKCKKFVVMYCENPHRFHKQCYRLQLELMLNNWQFRSLMFQKDSMHSSEHSYKDLFANSVYGHYSGSESESESSGSDEESLSSDSDIVIE